MCGIAGIINRKGMDISSKLIDMLELIQHRGPDASGIAVYGEGEQISLRVSITDKELHPVLINKVAEFGTIISESTTDWNSKYVFSEMILEMEESAFPKLHESINRLNGLCVHSIGKGMKVYKDGGMLDNLVKNHPISRGYATHGMGHVRMATESAEDINAAHPFVSPFYPELSIVHNGQFTNYFNLRRKLESKGAIFKTLNDSEAASHLIAYAMMKNGGDLEEALKYALEELDGIFCITLFPDVYAEEMEPGEVRVWNI